MPKITLVQMTTCYLALGIAGCSQMALEPARIEPALEEALDANADWLLAHNEIRSASIGYYDNGDVVLRHFGELDPGHGNTPGDDTIYEIASVTKTFTGSLLASAVAERIVDLDEDIRVYLGGEFSNLQFDGHPITVRHIAAHTAGLPRDLPDSSALWENFTDELPFKLVELASTYSKQRFIADLQSLELQRLPGAEYAYSNVGPNLIALILENVYDQPFEELLREKVFRPAGMTTTSLVVAKRDLERFANGYDETGRLMPHFVNPTWGAGGGYKSTFSDLMSYLRHQFTEDHPVWHSLEERDQTSSGSFQYYFWNVSDRNSDRRVTIHGGAYGTQTWISFYPERGLGVVVVTNESDENTGARISSIVPGKSLYIDLTKMSRGPGVEAAIAYYRSLGDELTVNYPLSDIESDLNRWGYSLLRKDDLAEAVSVFTLNANEFPQSANVYDSLGEAQLQLGDKESALANYRKSLALDPGNTNARRAIEEIEAK